jgi:beta-lactamase regulating signal transducer with metallopeptidase domain
MLAWMLYVIMVTLLLSIGAYVAERAARLQRGRSRWIWITAIVASLALPTVIASVTVQLPNVMSAAVAEKVVVLREATTQALSPVMWISGSAGEPSGWRDLDGTLTTLWRGASAAMLLALVASGLHLAIRKRRWRKDALAGAEVLVTEDVGPAVVGLLRPRIVVPRWVTMALPRHQSAVIAHEQSHLDAHDPQLFTFALALLVFMPWNLPLWWQLRRLRYAIEVDCDARVLASGLDAAHYGETLITVGERQSAYVGAVAAMSESRSFLEQRIRIMISKPVKWRRVGMAALAGVSLALTALAAQVSPPNIHTPASVRTADAPAAGGAPAKPGERVAIKLPAATVDQYVGAWKLDEKNFIDVKREGDKISARVTGQPWIEIFAERDGYFFYKVVDAQIEFSKDGTGTATLHQFGKDMPLIRVDPSESAQAQTAVEARIASQAATPGSEAELRHMIETTATGKIDYSRMEEIYAAALRSQESQAIQTMQNMGPIKSIEFRGVGQMGWDAYEVHFEKGTLNARITLGSSGKIAGLMIMAGP